MSNEIEPNLWAIQEKALKSSTSSQSAEEQAAIKEYQELYQMLEQLPEDEPPSVLAQTVSGTIAKRHRKERAGKVLTAGLCLLLIIGLVSGLVLLLPQSALFSQISGSLQMPLIVVAAGVFGIIGFVLKKLIN